MDRVLSKNSPIGSEAGWNVSFWFAVFSPLIGILLAYLTLVFFYN